VAEFRLEAVRRVLREWREEDRDHFWEMTRDSKMMRYLQPVTRNLSDQAVCLKMAH